MNLLPANTLFPSETVCKRGAANNILSRCDTFGNRGMLVCGRSLDRTGRLMQLLEEEGADADIRCWFHSGGEPTVEQLEALLEDARDYQPQWLLAIGGGSVMDIGKAAAGLLHAPLSVREYHDGAPLPPASIPFIAAPTTAGTGSEATSVSVLTDTKTGVKKSIRHATYLAKLVVLDASLLDDCPREVIAASGMDALTQAIESFCSRGASWLTDVLAQKAIALIREAIEEAYDGNLEKREPLLVAGYLAGMALANARLGLVHGLAHPLGARFHAPHGLACAICLPPVLAFNRPSIPEKYQQLSEMVGMDIAEYVIALNQQFRLHSPFTGKEIADEDAIVAETLASGSTQANPRTVSAENVIALLDILFSRNEPLQL